LPIVFEHFIYNKIQDSFMIIYTYVQNYVSTLKLIVTGFLLMTTSNKCRLAIAALFTPILLTASTGIALAETVGVWNVYEINITTTNTYSNPYLDVWLNANFTGPTKNIKIDGFWDGGKNWKVRMAPTEVGTWSYVTYSNDPQLNGKTGNFEVVESGKKGFIISDPDHAFSFKRSGGEHVFLMGDTNWNSMSDKNGALKFSTYKAYIDYRSDQKFNFIRSYIVALYSSSTDSAHYNEGGRAFEPWNPDRLNPGYFQEVDKRIGYANSKGITMHLLLGSDGTRMTDFFGWGNGKMERYVRYIAARYSAYDISWEGRAEFEEQGSTTPGAVNLANQIGNWFERFDPYNHVRSIHTLDSNNELGNKGWLDWIMHQSRDWNLIISDRKYNKPVMNEEFYYENSGAGATHSHHVDADTVRKGAWNVMTYGASGFAYGNTGIYNSRSQPFKGIQYAQSIGADYMTYLYNFWSTTEYWKLAPKNSIVKSGTASAAADPGNEYVVYLPTGGSTTIDLSAATGTLSVEWYNPRTGTYRGQTTVQGGASRTFTAPDSKDWVLHIKAAGGVPIASPSANPTSGEAPLTVNFTGHGSDPDGTIVSYHWDFGDGNTSSLRNTTHTYTSAGTYKAVLTVTDNEGKKGNSSITITSTSQDTTPPAVGDVSAPYPNKVKVFFLEAVEEASSTNISNYAIDNGITIYSASLGSDLKMVTLSTSAHDENINYTITISNIRDRASKSNIMPPTQVTYRFIQELTISNITASSGKSYSLDTLAVGKLQYIDRSYTFSSVPASYDDLKYIRTANDDKASSGNTFLEFDVNKDVTVYVAYDDRISSKPLWLESFMDTGDKLIGGGGTFSLYAKNFSAGHIALGGNEGNNSRSMYNVVLRPISRWDVADVDVVVTPQSKTVTQGQTFDLSVYVDPKGMAIAGVQMDIAFNKSILKVNSITEGDLFKQNGASTFFNNGTIDNSLGTVTDIYSAILGNTNVSTPGTLIIINVTAIGSSGTSSMDLLNVKTSDPDGNTVALNVTNGSVTINAPAS